MSESMYAGDVMIFYSRNYAQERFLFVNVL